MKKFILVLAAATLAAVAVSAQPRAIGARFGWGAEVSYQHSLGEANMISAELTFPAYYYGVGAAATYDWINPFNATIPWNHKGEWNWYLGAGAGLAYYYSPGIFGVGVGGRVGVEYNFWFPLQLSFDWRPLFGPKFGDENSKFWGGGLYEGIALGVRYKF